MSRLYGLVVEDQAIERILVALLRRLIGADLALEPRVMRGRPDLFGRFPGVLLEFKYRFPRMHKALIVCDSDRDDPAIVEKTLQEKKSRHPKLQALPFPVHFHAIKTEAETWLLSDEDAIATACGHRLSLPGGNLEDLRDAKEKFQQLLAGRKIVYTPGLIGDVAAALSFERLGSRCPGYVKFSRRAQNPWSLC